MIKKRIRLLSVLIAIVFVSLASLTSANAVTTFTYGAYTFADIDDNYVSLYGYDNSSDNLEVPAEFSGRYVKSIYDYAFENNTIITKLDFSKVSKKFKAIGINSFAGCTGLTGELMLPSSITSIGESAFFGCSGLETVLLYCAVKAIPSECFNRCSSIETVRISNTTQKIENLAFANCPSIKEVFIPFSVTEISENAFLNDNHVVLKCYTGSYAQQFAIDNGISYDLVDLKPGDADLNGVININDATMAQMHDVKLIELSDLEKKAADVSRDGDVTVRDATLIQMYLANIITGF